MKHHAPASIGLKAVAFAALFAGLVVISQAQSPAPTPAPPSTVLKDRLIDVGGYHLNFNVTPGAGSTVVLEPGGGGLSSQWRQVQESLWQKIGRRIVSYDRAGFGQSEPPRDSYTAMGEVRALHQALGKLGASRDLILVGFSFSGFLVQLYASQYPEDVKGIVMVDPDTVFFFTTVGVDFWMDKWEKSVKGKMSAAETRLYQAFPATVEQMKTVNIPSRIPVVLITSGLTPWGTRDPRLSAAWRGGHDQFVQAAPNRELVVATKSGHMVPLDEPDVIVESVTALAHRVFGKSQTQAATRANK